jgi:hypothetical protein
MIVPRLVAETRTCSASMITPRCVSVAPAGPRGAPNGNLKNSVRGGLTFSATSCLMLRQIVEIPASSKTRAISPTDC